ncbi:hypothetical protein H072_3622 [Dactylellina haptotyla CBS 200.50]|uniref:Uncharacterized protein n=1 Tax=Dactylellina haptotyla (strain CBS 200.50) TaxID=1284197 RepID=S8C3Z5_DACHA|nr:hypothetical protein H072_3622 [Dactylellina haptotyla CBS 200.50]
MSDSLAIAEPTAEIVNLTPELAAWWSVTIAIVLGRYILRAKRNGLKSDAPDWLMIIVVMIRHVTLAYLTTSQYSLSA